MYTHVHISVAKWCIVGYETRALWDLCNNSIDHNIPRRCPPHNISAPAPCNREGDHTWLFVRASDKVNEGHQRIMIRTVDINVVIASSLYQSFPPSLGNLGAAVGGARNYFSASTILNSIGCRYRGKKVYGLPCDEVDKEVTWHLKLQPK